jgi:multiple sugar transport system permease protein
MNIPLRYVKLDVDKAESAYVEFIRERYRDVKSYNVTTGDDAVSFEHAALSDYPPADSPAYQTWQDFYERAAPIASIVIESADVLYERFLRAKYSNVAALSEAYGTDHTAFAEVQPPWREADYQDLMTRKSEIRWSFLTRNYVYVIKHVFLQGRPIFNTFVLVTLTVVAAITINPLAAYALSRYRLRYGPRVLIFLLATMSFPAQVAMIPNFLLIKELGLLNTFAALILPTMANGFSVFLLKGFFDSLPQELYEAASIDGASEFRMFCTITMPLSLPILSVIGLYAFGAAYGSFLWAFTVCQDKKMWTLMVFLQQFQAGMRSHPYLVMASLVIAAIPTIVVFLSAQKVLMKGIVVPTMK